MLESFKSSLFSRCTPVREPCAWGFHAPPSALSCVALCFLLREPNAWMRHAVRLAVYVRTATSNGGMEMASSQSQNAPSDCDTSLIRSVFGKSQVLWELMLSFVHEHGLIEPNEAGLEVASFPRCADMRQSPIESIIVVRGRRHIEFVSAQKWNLLLTIGSICRISGSAPPNCYFALF